MVETQTLAIVIAICNEQENRPELFHRLRETFGRMPDIASTVIYVNDGSEDNSLRIMLAQRNEDPRLIAQAGNAYWPDLFSRYEQLRLARLASFLRRREPDSEINNSILVYRLEASGLARAIDEPPIELADTPLGNIKPGEWPAQPE